MHANYSTHKYTYIHRYVVEFEKSCIGNNALHAQAPPMLSDPLNVRPTTKCRKEFAVGNCGIYKKQYTRNLQNLLSQKIC